MCMYMCVPVQCRGTRGPRLVISCMKCSSPIGLKGRENQPWKDAQMKECKDGRIEHRGLEEEERGIDKRRVMYYTWA